MSASGLVTILFTDLVGFTGLSEVVGPAAADQLRRDHFASLRRAAAATGGEEVKTIGDSLMLVYQGAADALAGAVALQQAVDRHNRSLEGALLAMRIGISAGDATSEDGDWFGRPVVEAARLCAEADGGQILAAELVQTLAGTRGDHAFIPLGERVLRGLPDAVAVCEVAWSPVSDDEELAQLRLPDALTRATGSGLGFVGREPELESLATAWKEVVSGGRQLVLVSGEPGIGKTRLAAELARLAHDEGGIVLWGGCDEDLGVPYQPVAEALGHVIHSMQAATLPAMLGPLGGELSRLVPDLDALVPGFDQPFEGDPDIERHRLFEAVNDAIANLAHRRPVLLVVDDLHWAAKPTLLMLRQLLRAPQVARLLVVGTYRDTDLDRRHPLAEMLADLRRGGDVERLALGGLGADGVEALMESAAGHDLDTPGRALADAVHRETEGNPFFIREVLLHLAESGELVHRDGRWTSDVRPDQMGIPEGVREVIGRRLSRLPDATNQLLAAASVLGREFDLGLLASLHEDGDSVLDDFEPAERANLVRSSSGRPGSYVFAHALVRSTLYDELPTSRRLRLHREAGRALEARGDREAHLSDLARHFSEAAALGEVSRAVQYGRRAGDRALADLAFEDAGAHYERALGVLDLADREDRSLRYDLLLALGTAQARAADPRDRETLLAAVALARDVDDPDRLTDATLVLGYNSVSRYGPGRLDEERLGLLHECLDALPEDDSPRRAKVLNHVATTMWMSEEAERREVSDEALAMARRVGDPSTLVEVLNGRYAAFNLSDPHSVDEWIADFSEMIDLAGDISEALACSGHLSRSAGYLLLGERARAEADLEAARQLGERLREPALVSRIRVLETTLTLLDGRLAEAEEQIIAYVAYSDAHDLEWVTAASGQYYRLRYEQGRLDELIDTLIERVDSDPRLPAWRIALAGAYAQTDHLEEARTQVRWLVEDGYSRIPANPNWIFTVAGIARVAGMIGELEIAATAYDLALPYAGQLAWTGVSVEQPIDLSLGTAAGALGRFDAAEAHFKSSIELSERAGAPTYVAVSRLHWALMLSERDGPGDADRARQLAGEALATARELGLGRIDRVASELVG